MIYFDVISIFPNMFATISKEGVIARAMVQNIITMKCWQLRDFSQTKYRNIDDKPYGGGSGMVMQVKPIRDCLAQIRKSRPSTEVIYLSPQGQPLTQSLVNILSKKSQITLLCGRYQGVDERIIERDVDLEISLGDFVISGGELVAMVLIDAITRQLPNVLGNEESKNESFSQNLLEPPLYTRPEVIDGQSVPSILLSGHRQNIKQYQQQQALKNTKKKRPELLENKAKSLYNSKK